VQGRVTGRVQGVGYRASFAREARALGVSGWVRNCPDGSVAFLAQGGTPAVDQIVEWARTGPRFARVEDLELSHCEPTPSLREFEVRY
jgi:acylphosphatase